MIHPLIAPESCSNLQEVQHVFESALKKNFWFRFFVSDVISEVDFWPFWLMLPGLAQPLDGSISLKFSLETRLESESFEPLINFLTFLVQKL